MSNLYEALHRPPRLHRRLPAAQEKLARALVASGKLRLDADNESNFTRLLLPRDQVNFTFTFREMEGELRARSQARIIRALSARHAPEQAQALAKQHMETVQNALKKKRNVSPGVELKMARALVSCNAFAVIELIHLEGADIFISYGHSVSDVMDIATWQDVGEAGGLQAAAGEENAIYIACGGHPFLTAGERTYSTDGFPALSRFFVIAAQETGHNADMIRDAAGQRVGRYSALDWGRAPSNLAGPQRRADDAHSQHILRRAQQCGLNLVAEWERHLAFYRANKLRNTRSLAAWLKSRLGWLALKWLLRLQRMGGVTHLQRDSSPATLLRSCLADMCFNLNPLTEAYRRPDPLAEEATLCIEAVARVPQQVVKWGHRATRCCMPRLYPLYYLRIVPACAQAAARIKHSSPKKKR